MAETLFHNITRHYGEVGACGTCINAQGMTETDLSEGTHRSTLDQLADWVVWADKALVF